mmetsp:Transcript_22994/g.47658  ORF Transcript_22994/g.47658 Transcript_22994/m.47658 type:complete len:340 (+) Transcript_22994:73-1092(+)
MGSGGRTRVEKMEADAEIPVTDDAKVVIVDPPMDSTVMGTVLSVKVGIEPVNTKVFTESYSTPTSRICVSLDSSPYSCWPVINGIVRYVALVPGPHVMHAVLMKDGVMKEGSMTDEIRFTSVEDPDLEDEGEEGKKKEEEEEEEEIDLDENERVQIDIPKVIMHVPPSLVTLPGDSAQIVSTVQTNQKEMFDKFFRHQFVCYNLDGGTGSPCWNIFNKDHNDDGGSGGGNNMEGGVVPFFTGLEPGIHTVEGVITHPENGEGIAGSETDVRTFYTSGLSNEAASVVVEIQVDTENHYMPVCRGSDAKNQGFYFCGSRGITQESCQDFVAEKILNAYRAI